VVISPFHDNLLGNPKNHIYIDKLCDLKIVAYPAVIKKISNQPILVQTCVGRAPGLVG
jgi:hypothetical protein